MSWDDRGEESTEISPASALSLTRARPQRVVAWADAAGAHSVPIEGKTIAGSSRSAPICVEDRTVSRVHAELDVREDGVWLRDLGSRNGSWVENVLCEVARVPDGGRIRLGGTTLELRVTEPAARVALWPDERFGDLVAQSEPMRELFMQLSRFAASDAPVLIQGETGTGKELVARAIHDASPRAGGPFAVVDCAALPESLLESELFGHAKGAFTGAIAARAGAFEAASGGTIFLDEIGELPLAMQPKLLRVLESQTIRRLGETSYRNVDVRFLCATHRDLQSLVATTAFREDLFFRVAVLPAYVPPLRARRGDIPLLVSHFLERRAPGMRIPPAVMAELEQHPWLGNVRELRSFVDRVATIGAEEAWAITRGVAREGATPAAPARTVDAANAPSAGCDVGIPFKELREQWTDHLERHYIGELLRIHGRNLAAIAAAAQLDRTYVRRLILKHGL